MRSIGYLDRVLDVTVNLHSIRLFGQVRMERLESSRCRAILTRTASGSSSTGLPAGSDSDKPFELFLIVSSWYIENVSLSASS